MQMTLEMFPLRESDVIFRTLFTIRNILLMRFLNAIALRTIY